ncbi:MAG TPA: hypothetical protein VFY12_07250 [Arenimonas sp.]|nr:hypothetical protein [Arenimonas sp.]
MTRRKDIEDDGPALGAIDALAADGASDAAMAVVPRRRHRTWLWLLPLLLLALLAAALLRWREPLGRWLVPDPPLTQQLAQAEAALRRGELSRSDGRGARELFQAMLAADPDHPGARRGLAAVREAALDRAALALDAGEREQARDALQLATALSAPLTRLQPLEARLRVADASGQDLEQLLGEAQSLWQGGRDVEALAMYQQVLLSHPDNALALSGRQQILGEWLRQADEALERGDLTHAEARVAEVLAYDASHIGLPALQARLGEVRAEHERLWRQRLAEAQRAESAGELSRAWPAYQDLLRHGPVAADARAGRQRVLQAQAQHVRESIQQQRWQEALRGLRVLRGWSPGFEQIEILQAQLERARPKPAAASIASQDRPPVALDAGAVAQAAAAAITSGRLLQPPGDSAWDHLRELAGTSPDDPRLPALWRQFEQAARACYEQHALGNRLTDAESCLDARALREPSSALADARRRLALRWVALASERLGQNEPELAERALGNARRLDPRTPGLAATERRLQALLGVQR